MKRKILSLLLVVLMVVALVPMFIVSTSATETTLYENDFSTSVSADDAIAGENVTLSSGQASFGGWKDGSTWEVTKDLTSGGLVTIKADIYPNFNSSGWKCITINGKKIVSSGGGFTVALAGAPQNYNSATNKVVYVTITIDPITGAGTVNYTQSQSSMTNRSSTFTIDPFTSIKLELGQAQTNSWKADNVSIKQADDYNPRLSVTADAETYRPGDTVEVTVAAGNNTWGTKYFGTVVLTKVFDDSAFEFVSVEKVGSIFTGSLETGLNEVLDGGTAANGEFLKYTYTVKDTATPGNYTFSINPSDVSDADANEYDEDIVVNSVTVEVLEPLDQNGSVAVEGYQFSQAVGGEYNIRFIVSGNFIDLAECVGLNIVTTNLDTNYEWDITTGVVYDELSASFGTAPKATDFGKEYVTSFTLTGVPATEKEIEFEVQPRIVVEGIDYTGEKITVKTEYYTIVYENNFDSDITKNGATKPTDGSTSKSGGKLSLPNWGESWWQVAKTVETTGEITITFDMYPNWSKTGDVMSINGTALITTASGKLIINGSEGYNTASNYPDPVNKVIVTVTIDPATGAGEIVVDQTPSSLATRSNTFELGEGFSELTLKFGKQGNGWFVDNLLIKQ